MPPERDETAITRWATFSAATLAAMGGVELAILKTHLVLEELLRFVLAKRMGLSDDAFGHLRINFATLLEISTAEIAKPHLVGALRALNDARNHVSHRIESAEVASKMSTFMQEVGQQLGKPMSWPGDPHQQLRALDEASGEAAVELIQIALR